MSLYIELTHGRRLIAQTRSAGLLWEKLNDWGVDGPIFGPFPHVHGTYASQIQLGDDAILEIVDGLVIYDRVGYGDWTIADRDSMESRPDFVQRHSQFRQSSANVDFLSQDFVVIMKEQEEDRPLYLCEFATGESWSADIDLAAAFTVGTARQLAATLASTLKDHEMLYVGKLQYIPSLDSLDRSDMPVPIERI